MPFSVMKKFLKTGKRQTFLSYFVQMTEMSQ